MKKLGDFTDTDDRQLVADAVAWAERENTVAASKLACLAEIDRRGLALKLGASSITRWWAKGTRVTDGNAAKQIEHAYWLCAWPVVHEALVQADIHLAHSVAVHDGLDAVIAADPSLSDKRAAAIVADLLDVARTDTVHTVGRRATTLALAAAQDARARAEKARAAAEEEARRKADEETRHGAGAGAGAESKPDPDSSSPTPAPGPDPAPLPTPPVPASENATLNRLSIHPLANGRNRIEGNLDTLTTDRLKASLNAHSAPVPGPDGERDPRPAAQRTADALATLLDRDVTGNGRPTFAGTIDLAALTRLNSADTGHDIDGPDDTRPTDPAPHPTNGPVPPAFTSPPKPMTAAYWPFQLAWSGPISHALALLVTCDAQLNPIVIDGAGVPLAMGRAVRTVTAEQRTAVTVRDRCCIMCGRPAQWCQVHHLVHWAHGGTTDLDNLALLCGECHRHVHQHGWEIVLGGDHHPRIIPPATADPQRKPLESYHRLRRRRAA